jgi:hypothetical protein
MKFQKGNKAGKRGRPKKTEQATAASLAEYINKKTNNLQDLVDIVVDMLGNEKLAARDKLTATTFLATRSIGNPVQGIEGSIDNNITITVKSFKDED